MAGKKSKEPFLPAERQLRYDRINKARSIVQETLQGFAMRSTLTREELRRDMESSMSLALEEAAERSEALGRWIPLNAISSAIEKPIDDLLNNPSTLPDSMDIEAVAKHLQAPGGEFVVNRSNGKSEERRRTQFLMKLEQGGDVSATSDTGDVAPAPDVSDVDTTTEALAEDGDQADQSESEYSHLANEVLNRDLTRPNYCMAPAGEAIASLDAQIKSGPADTTAIHDFHSIRIAFPGMWSHIVDPSLRDQLEQLLRGLIEIEHNHEFSPLFVSETIDESEILELDQLISLVEEAIPSAEAILAPPPSIEHWKPELVQVWHDISLEQQNIAVAVHWIATILYPAIERFEHSLGVRLEERLQESYDQHTGKLNFDKGTSEFGVQYPDVEVADKAVPFLPSWTIGLAFMGPEFANQTVINIVNSVENRQAETDASISTSISRLKELLLSVKQKRLRNYGFDIFRPRSYNFGLIVTYRQSWRNTGYQVGDLVSTLPLAPGEKRTVEIVKKTTTKRFQKEIENSIQSRKGESEDRTRADSEIVRRAKTQSDFGYTAESSIGLPLDLGEAKTSAKFNVSTGRESSQTKKGLREAVRKAATEYRNEHTLEITSEVTFETDYSETSTIENTNNEITVTYLFYELQQKFEVSEALHKVQPVVLVAFDVPKPDEVTEDWVLEHSWILRRVLLDDSFEDALGYISSTFAGDELAVEILKRQWQTHLKIVESLRSDLSLQLSLNDRARSAVLESQSSGDNGSLWSALESLLGSDITDSNAEGKRDAAQLLLDWAQEDVQRASSATREAVSSLVVATDNYIAAVRDRLNRRVAIDQLLLHLQQNIIYYMKAIWSHEPTDQRYLRLYDLLVRAPKIGGECVIQKNSIRTDLELDSNRTFAERHYIRVRCPSPKELGPERRLYEIADLSQLLGFKGNYAIFPLLEGNGISEFMMQDYLHEYYGVYDPDPKADRPTLDDLNTIFDEFVAGEVASVTDRQPISGGSDVSGDRANMKMLAELAKTATVPDSQEIVVPTSSLFVEALPGSHPLLENFKLLHRAEDLRKAQLEADSLALENIRRAARISEDDLRDPETDKTIVIKGDSDINVDT